MSSSLPDALQRLFGGIDHDILWWQMCIRGVVIFLFGLALIRLFGRRAFGKYTPLDIVLAIVIGSNLSRALTANSPFVPTLAATTVLVVCYWLIDHLAARWSAFGSIVKGKPVVLVRGGQLDRRQMRRNGISEGDLAEAARKSGVGGIEAVETAVLERNGDISVH